MDLQNLKEHHEELLSFMENNGYSSTYIRRFREEINRILAKADSHDWQSYRDVYLDYLKAPHSKDYLRNKRTIIGALSSLMTSAACLMAEADIPCLRGDPIICFVPNSEN